MPHLTWSIGAAEGIGLHVADYCAIDERFERQSGIVAEVTKEFVSTKPRSHLVATRRDIDDAVEAVLRRYLTHSLFTHNIEEREGMVVEIC